jgi:ubiquinone/menaquinone biosynthesis C-methylase UbiE
MQQRHSNRITYFNEQAITTEKHVMPFINEVKKIDNKFSVLEIGCGEGGNLFPFIKLQCEYIVGIDLSSSKIEKAKAFLNHESNSKISLMTGDFFEMKVESDNKFDLIMARDVLEHIHGHEQFLMHIKNFMKEDGILFLGFPPWQNPFGGHQQMCSSKILSITPYFHLLPNPLYIFVLQLFGEKKRKIDALMEIKSTHLTMETFEKLIERQKFKKLRHIPFFINPNYEVKFGIKPRKLWNIFWKTPFFRNFLITTNYYVLSKN